MRKFILGGLLFFNCTIGQAQSSKTFIKSIVNGQSDVVVIDVNCQKTIKYWDKDYVRIYFTIESSVNESTLSSLALAGRYDHITKLENGVPVFTMPNLMKQVIMGGIPISEKLSMEIFVPDNIKVTQPSI